MWNLFIYKRNEEKKIRQIWHLEIFHKIKCFQIEKKGNTTWCMKSICFTFQKIIFCGKIKFKKEKKKEKKKKQRVKKNFTLMLDFYFIYKRLFYFLSSHINIFKIGPEIHKKLWVEQTKSQICQSQTKSNINWKCYHYTRKWMAFIESKKY